MALREISFDLDSRYIKSYKTRERLMAEIEKLQDFDNDDRFIVVNTPTGRWTAIVILDRNTGGYLGRYPFASTM